MPAVPYKTSDYLKTPQAIVEYLKLVLEDPESDHEDLLVAVRNVSEATNCRPPDPGPAFRTATGRSRGWAGGSPGVAGFPSSGR